METYESSMYNSMFAKCTDTIGGKKLTLAFKSLGSVRFF